VPIAAHALAGPETWSSGLQRRFAAKTKVPLRFGSPARLAPLKSRGGTESRARHHPSRCRGARPFISLAAGEFRGSERGTTPRRPRDFALWPPRSGGRKASREPRVRRGAAARGEPHPERCAKREASSNQRKDRGT
jgi:hypothetical protein